MSRERILATQPKTCSVVAGIDCKAAPDYPRTGRIASCGLCGNDVCLSCSSLLKLRTIHGRRTLRVCDICRDDDRTQRSIEAAR